MSRGSPRTAVSAKLSSFPSLFCSLGTNFLQCAIAEQLYIDERGRPPSPSTCSEGFRWITSLTSAYKAMTFRAGIVALTLQSRSFWVVEEPIALICRPLNNCVGHLQRRQPSESKGSYPQLLSSCCIHCHQWLCEPSHFALYLITQIEIS